MFNWLDNLFKKDNTGEDLEESLEPLEPIPDFKYHPFPLETGAFEQDGKTVICHCCGRTTRVYYEYPFDTDLIPDDDFDIYFCADCIKNGEASKKFRGVFQNPNFCEKVADKTKLEELCKRTPGYYAPRQAYWLAHCDDFCALVEDIFAWSELAEKGLESEVEEDWVANADLDINDINLIKKRLRYSGKYFGYLFRCLHCGKYRLYVDSD